MKKLITLLFVFASNLVFAQVETFETLIKEQDIQLNLKLDEQTVRCLVGDYGASSLKISVSDLKHYTVFRHTTWGETEPCINAGFCGNTPMGQLINPDLIPEKIIDLLKPYELADLNIKLFEVITLDQVNKSCTRRLREHVSSTVRGVLFQHEDGAGIGSLDYDTCLTMVANKK